MLAENHTARAKHTGNDEHHTQPEHGIIGEHDGECGYRTGHTAEGINATAFWAYRRSEDAGNDLIDFSEVIWDEDIDPIAETFRENGITEFTISSTFSGLIPTLAAFEKRGFQMAGITEVNATYTDWQTNQRARIPAIRMVQD